MAPTETSSRPSVARQRVLDTASRLFYAEGIHNVGVDRVIAEAGVTRATFYRHFPSKEDLVRTYVEARSAHYRSVLAGAYQVTADPRELLTMLLTTILEEVCGPQFRGCPFVNAAVEYPDPAHQVRQAVDAHRDWFRQMVWNLVTAAGHPDPDYATGALVMLRDGAMTGGYLGDSEVVRAHILRIAKAILAT